MTTLCYNYTFGYFIRNYLKKNMYILTSTFLFFFLYFFSFSFSFFLFTFSRGPFSFFCPLSPFIPLVLSSFLSNYLLLYLSLFLSGHLFSWFLSCLLSPCVISDVKSCVASARIIHCLISSLDPRLVLLTKLSLLLTQIRFSFSCGVIIFFFLCVCFDLLDSKS